VHRLRSALSTAASDRWAAVGLVSLIACLTYGLLLPWLGFYRDDWYQLWAGATFGPRSIVTLFSIDRPVMGYTYAATYYFLRDSVVAWQLYALFLRWLGALGALWLFRRLWPGRPLVTTAAALLFLVYPGFQQQPNADTFSNHLVSYTAEVLSLAATAELLARPRGWRRVGLTLFAVAGALTCWFLYEYMIGLEVLRYFLIGRSALRESGRLDRRWLGRFAAEAAPFLIPLLVFLTWRLAFFQATRAGVDVSQVLSQYAAAPVLTLFGRLVELARDFVETEFFGWFVPSFDRLSALDPVQVVLALLPAVVAVAAFRLYARSRRDDPAAPRPAEPTGTDPGPDLILVGSLTTLASLTPVILTGRDVRWTSAFDRYTLHATLGLAMLTVGLLASTIRARARAPFVGALLGLSVLAHQANAYAWARFWDEQKQLWWQLSWRAPGLEPGTVLMARLPSQRYFEDYEIWGPANLIYDPGDRSPKIGAEVIAEDTVPRVWLGLKDVRTMRELIQIPRDYNDVLVVDWPSPQSCVHVLEQDLPESGVSSGALVQSIASFSRGDRIRTEDKPAALPRLLGRESAHGWCWYYQSAALARQRGDWNAVVALGDEAHRLGLAPEDPTEWMPFFQAYLNLGRSNQGRAVADSILAAPVLAQQICLRLRPDHFVDEATYLHAREALCRAAR
jgi:hypothetical protein